MDHLKNLGSLALASRLRRALEEIQRQGRRIYAELGVNFEVRWFSVFHFLTNYPKSTITQTATSFSDTGSK